MLDGSTLQGSPFCVGGTILDVHASLDPAMDPYGLIDRKITCPDGTVRIGLTPDEPSGVWTIATGTGEFEGLGGSGEMEIVYGPEEGDPAHETYTGTVER